MSSSSDTTLDTCTCCEDEEEVPEIDNPPGQSSLSYRVGTHGSFLKRMLLRLHQEEIADGDNAGSRPLAALTTRSTEDPSIALLDAWAVVGDVLTFYQERIANEGYLRTATERRSVLELARAIAYELSPGVAASTYLAFTVEDAAGAPGVATIPQGTQVQSIPAGQGELPQTFETEEAFEARAEWNTIYPRLTQRQVLPENSSQLAALGRLYLSGVSTQLKAGDLLLLVALTVTTDVDGNEEVTGTYTAVKRVKTLETDTTQNWTQVDFEDGSTTDPPVEATATYEDGVLTLEAIPFTAENIEAEVLGKRWSESDLSAFLTIQGWDEDALLEYVESRESASLRDDEGVFAFRDRVGLFGHNAPRWESLPSNQKYGEYTDTSSSTTNQWVSGVYSDNNWDAGHGNTIWTDSQETASYDVAWTAHIFLERTVSQVVAGGWVVLDGREWEEAKAILPRPERGLRSAEGGPATSPVGSGAGPRTPPVGGPGNPGFTAGGYRARQIPYRVASVVEASLADYALSGKATGLELTQKDGDALEADYEDRTGFLLRKTVAHVRSEQLELADVPYDEEISAGDTTLLLYTMVLGLKKGQVLALTGERSDADGVTVTELVTLEEIHHAGGYTELTFAEGLQYGYVRDTVTLQANLVAASHGETVKSEILGSGDGTQTHQRFTLRKTPLTYVSAATSSGAESTLTLKVNGITWTEVESLYGLDADSQSYVVRLEDDGTTSVVFGDGINGARLPTGRDNVVATYRIGLGADGEVDAGSLSLLKTRPFGVKKVTNPTAASGAEDPEALEDARENAPLTVLTLDRVVSLQDFEDFARTFAGIGKAQAVDLTRSEVRLVHITIADADGDAVESTSTLYQSLKDAIDAARAPGPEVVLDSFELLYFNVSAALKVDDAYTLEDVQTAVEDALKEAFAFDARDFGQPVTAAEVIQVIHSVDGIEAVDLDALYQVDSTTGQGTASLATILWADGAGWIDDEIAPAQLMLLNPYGITLTEMTT